MEGVACFKAMRRKIVCKAKENFLKYINISNFGTDWTRQSTTYINASFSFI